MDQLHVTIAYLRLAFQNLHLNEERHEIIQFVDPDQVDLLLP
jgi:hypothetical protein